MKNFKNRFFLPARICGNRKGFALLIVMGFCLIIGIMSIGMITQTIRTMQRTRDEGRAGQVYYAAQSGIEFARMRLRELKEGSETATSGTENMDFGGEVVTVDWKIKVSTNKGEGDYFYVPNPGEGSASGNCKSYENDDKKMDHPCSWNKIYVGETVNIPLWFYGESTDTIYGTPDGIIDPVEQFDGKKLENFYLRMRTPCVNGGEDPGCVRYMFYGDGNLYNTPIRLNLNKTIVNWELSGIDKLDDTKNYLLQPNAILQNSNDRTTGYDDCAFSEIYQELLDSTNQTPPSYPSTNCNGINSLQNVKVDSNNLKNICLSNYHKGKSNDNQINHISKFLLNTDIWASNNLHKPVLKIQVIDELRLQEDQKDTPLLKDQAIPYLEYQVMTNRPIGNARRIIEATAKLGNTEEKITWDEAQEGAMGGFAVQN